MPSPVRTIVLALLLLFMADGALRAQTATTGAATGVTDLTATLSGTFAPDVGNTYWVVYFQVGTDTSYGQTVEANPYIFEAEGGPPQAVTLNLSQRQPNTTYHYRLMAESLDGPSVTGQDMTFTTGPAVTPPSISGTLGCYQLQKEHLLLALPNVAAGAAQATVVVEYGLTTDYGSTQTVTTLSLGTSSGSEFMLGGLTPNTTYHARVKAISTLGTAVSADASFTTLTPAVLATGNATGITDLGVTLNATLTQNGNYLNEIFFQYGTSTNYSESLQVYGTGQDPQALSGTVTDLLPNTVYHFRLGAYDWEDGQISGPDQTFTTGAAGTPPVVSGVVSGSDLSPTVVSAYCASVFSGSSAATVIFEYGTSTAYGTVVQPLTTPIPVNTTYTAVEMNLTGLTPGTTYHIRCTATNAQGSVSSADSVFTTLPAPVLTTSAATGVTDLNALFNGTINTAGVWMTPEFEWGTGTGYGQSVQASLTTVHDAATHAVTGTPFGLQPSTTYHYRIRAYDGNNVYYYGPDMTFTTGVAATPPTLGTVFTDSVGTTEASVDCVPVFAGSSPATVYFDYGTSTAYGSTVQAGDPLIPNGTAFAQVTLNGLTLLTTYHVRCRVVNNEGSATSADLAFTTSGIPAVTTNPATGVTDLSATLNGSVIANGPLAVAYPSFDFGTDTNYGSSVGVTPEDLISTALTPFTGAATGLLPNTTYHYRAKVYYSLTNLTCYGADASFTTGVPATPPTVSAAFTNAVSDTSAAVEAATVTAGSSDATVIWEFGPSTAYGSMVISNPGTIPVSTSNSASAVITGLTPSTTYHYRCTATNAQGSASSADATFTTAASPVLVTSPQYTATDLTAALNGSVSFNGNIFGGFYFEWGTDTTYGTQGGATATGASDPETITGTATGLLPNSTYHYRVKGVTTGNLWYYGQDQTLTTGPPNTPPSLVTGSGGVITTTSESLNVSSLQSGSSATTLSYDYGLDTTYGTTVVYPTPLPPSQSYNVSGNTLPVPVSGLTPGTTYHFRARAVNHEGSAVGLDGTFTTAAVPTLTTLDATSVSTVSALLNGEITGQGVNYSASFDYGPTTDYGSNVPGFSIFVSSGGGGTIGGTINFGNSGGLTKVGAGNLIFTGTNTYSGGTLVLNSGTGLVNLSGGTLTGSTGTGATPPTASGSLTLPTLGSGAQYSLTDFLAGPISTGGSLTGLTPNTTYHYRLKVTDSSGNTYYGNDMTFTTVGPDAVAQSWRQSYFGSPDNSGPAADMANPSGDGIPNLLKYALGINPDVSANGAMPQPVLKTFDGLTYLDYTFQRDASMTDLTYAVQVADSPAGPWTTIASSVGGAPTTGPGLVTENSLLSLENVVVSLSPNTLYVVEVRDIVSTADAPRRFLRLQVTRP